MRTVLTSSALAAALAMFGLASMSPADSTTLAAHTHQSRPAWMTRECKTEDSVNCHWSGGSVHPRQGEAYVRQLPGRTHLVCVLFVNQPRKDYCA